MSNYLTPRQVETYEELIKKLLYSPNTSWAHRIDFSPSQGELLMALHNELDGPVTTTCSWMASHIRDLIQASNKEQNDKEIASLKLPSSGSVFNDAIKAIHKLVQEKASQLTTYDLLLQIYQDPAVNKVEEHNLWVLDIHISSAMRSYIEKERPGIIDFLNPTQPRDF